MTPTERPNRMRTGRNESCPCGSKKKFKNCCEGKASRSIPKGLIVLIAVLAIIAGIAFIPNSDEARPTSIPSGSSNFRPGPQPAGPAPPGKVWSTEHGHWHEAPVAGARPASPIQVQQSPSSPLRPSVTSTPQPAGEVPPGKVWSTEHGHWHDLPVQK